MPNARLTGTARSRDSTAAATPASQASSPPWAITSTPNGGDSGSAANEDSGTSRNASNSKARVRYITVSSGEDAESMGALRTVAQLRRNLNLSARQRAVGLERDLGPAPGPGRGQS